MGRDKAFIKINGIFLIDRIIGELEKLSKNIILVVDKKEKYAQISKYEGVKIFEDEHKDIGPTEGMRIGLKNTDLKDAFVCACDMPFLSGDCVEELYGYKDDKTYCVIPEIENRIHPLHGFYDKNVINMLEFMVANEIRQIRYLFDNLETRFVDRFECNMALSTANVNSPEELEKLKKRGVVYG
jgi:molybdopterin-guanine dinucleotide biosynthesis protein A